MIGIVLTVALFLATVFLLPILGASTVATWLFFMAGVGILGPILLIRIVEHYDPNTEKYKEINEEYAASKIKK